MADEVMQVIAKLQRMRYVSDTRGVFPWMVQPWLSRYRSEKSLRYDMVALWHDGRLHRFGGEGARRGYCIADPQKRKAGVVIEAPFVVLPQAA
jgi:hypothetical protein